ncbi:hypothetical protein QRX46_07135 [Bifidobacterium sp. H1HS10N]|nr:hypothetical protein [Bifidobacterium sp. H1HS10N]MDT7513189.1 hypothetical protein [Bifidobacterium sp. H1HS10N]
MSFESQIVGDGLAEVVGDGRIAIEPAVKKVAVLGGIVGPFCLFPICDALLYISALQVCEGDGVLGG